MTNPTHKAQIEFRVINEPDADTENAEAALTAMCHYLDQNNLASKMWIVDALGRLAMEIWKAEESADITMRSLAGKAGIQ